MKFKIVYAVVALIMVSCGKLGDKTKDVVDAVSNAGSSDVNNIILYNNAMVAYMNEAGNKIDRTANEYERIYKMVTDKKKPIAYTGVAFVGSDPSLIDRSNKIDILNPGSYLPSDAKDKLKESIKNASDAFNNTKESYTTLRNYVRNEDFKDDDWEKGKELTESIKENISKFYDNQELSYKILKPIADEAEEELLKDHPLKENLIATKTDLNLAVEIVGIVYAEQIDMDALTAKYKELEANYAKHKDLTPDLLKKQNKDTYYNSFYQEIEEFLGEVRKCKRDGKITEREAEGIGRDYKNLIGYYNRFV